MEGFNFSMETPMQWIYLVLLVNIIVLPVMEIKGFSFLHYSKFRKESGISGKLGMFILYFVPIPACLAMSWNYLFTAEITSLILIAAIVLHFSKRCLESLFLHKYSGTVDIATVISISAIYSSVAALGAWLFEAAPAFDVLFAGGLALYAVGQLGNFYHHKLLADLRETNEGYFVPTGGMFSSLVCPHYFFEVISWMGVALMSHQFAMILVVILMFNYLAARAWKTRNWYVEKFDEYPAKRKLILPGIL